jgi:lipopolysaccharide biosynthesis glycosyltransferase
LRSAVVLAADAKIFPAAAFAATRFAALNDRADTDVIVFTDSATAEQAAALSLPFEVRALAVPAEAGVSPYFHRFFIPDTLAATHGRAIYLDVDTYADDARLFRLFDLDLRGHVFAAVRDAVVAFVPGSPELALILPKGNTRYVNSGVLVIDIARFHAERLVRQLLRIAKGKRQGFHAYQSALNLLLRGEFVELSPAFNLITPLWNSFVRGIVAPSIVHFAGVMKPWHGPGFRLDHPARREMERYLAMSPWPDFLRRFAGSPGDLLSRPVMVAPSFDVAFEGKDAFLRYLRETEFADVAAGLAKLNLDALPKLP